MTNQQTGFHNAAGWLLAIGQAVQRELELTLHEVDLSLRHFRIMAAIDRMGPSSQRQLTRHLGIDKSLMVIAVDGLEQFGLAARVKDVGDRRVQLVTLTAEGRRRLRIANRRIAAVGSEFLEPLDARDRRQFMQALEQLMPAEQEQKASRELPIKRSKRDVPLSTVANI